MITLWIVKFFQMRCRTIYNFIITFSLPSRYDTYNLKNISRTRSRSRTKDFCVLIIIRRLWLFRTCVPDTMQQETSQTVFVADHKLIARVNFTEISFYSISQILFLAEFDKHQTINEFIIIDGARLFINSVATIIPSA